jgi:hypothetical protein
VVNKDRRVSAASLANASEFAEPSSKCANGGYRARSNQIVSLLFLFLSLLALVGNRPALAQGPLVLRSTTFFGGPGDQRGTGIAIGNGAIYLSGDVQPETQGSADAALVLSYAIPTAKGSTPAWSRSFAFGTDLFGIAATDEGVYADGWNYSLSTDNVGGKEVKSIMAKFALDGSGGAGAGGSIWESTPNFFSYSGVELFQAATMSVESGSNFVYAAGLGQPCSFDAYIIAKFDSSGNLIASATDSSVGIQFNQCFVPSAGG